MLKPGLPAAIAGLVMFADILLAGLLLDVRDDRVYLAGRLFNYSCGFRQSTGLPCPTCGLTRSLVFGLHGQLSRSWALAPVGPLALTCVFASAIFLLLLAAVQFAGWERASVLLGEWLVSGLQISLAILMSVWLLGWGIALWHAAIGQ